MYLTSARSNAHRRTLSYAERCQNDCRESYYQKDREWDKLFYPEAWKTIALVCTVLGWVFGGFTILSGIIAYWATSNVDLLKKAPRSLTPAQLQQIEKPEDAPAQTTPLNPGKPQEPTQNKGDVGVLLISIGGPESDTYADQIASALAGNFKIARFLFGSMNNAEPGVSFSPNGHDPKPMLDRLERAGIHAKLSSLPFVPIPGSVRAQYSGFLVLLIGPKPAD